MAAIAGKYELEIMSGTASFTRDLLGAATTSLPAPDHLGGGDPAIHRDDVTLPFCWLRGSSLPSDLIRGPAHDESHLRRACARSTRRPQTRPRRHARTPSPAARAATRRAGTA